MKRPRVGGAVRPLFRWRMRRYRPGDFASVRKLWRAADLRLGPSDSREELELTRRRDPELFLVATGSGRVIGAVLGRFDGRRGWINHLAVDSQYRSLGVGSELVREVERRLKAKGCRKVNLHVMRENRKVVEFYRRLGYEVAPLLFMEKWLRG